MADTTTTPSDINLTLIDPDNLVNPYVTGIPSATVDAQVQATTQDIENANSQLDWRVRLSLAGSANYLYRADNSGILTPLKATNGVIFPYTPAISVTYGATYNSVVPAHSNYKIFQYESSNVDNITLTCDFTAQDVFEANYVLAVIHFFKSVTKMFYGQDENPKPGTPPPLCFLSGLGIYQFNKHPLAITNFTYTLPTDVDYIRAGDIGTVLQNSGDFQGIDPNKNTSDVNVATSARRLAQGAITGIGSNPQKCFGSLLPGGVIQPLGQRKTIISSDQPTYVPTKIQISVSAVPIVTRYDVSNNFSLATYSDGSSLSAGGFW